MRLALVAVLGAGSVFGQDAMLIRLKHEAASLQTSSKERRWSVSADYLAPLHFALREWIESRLPRNAHELWDAKGLEATLQGELKKAGLSAPDTPPSEPVGPEDWPGLGYVEMEFKWFPELPDALFVTAGVAAICGTDEDVYLYHFDDRGRTRVFEDNPATEWRHSIAGIELSEPDTHGRRLLLTHYMSVQCASTWMAMAYSVYRLNSLGDARELLLSGEHGFWLQMEQPIVLKPDELIIELKDHSVDMFVHNRTEILRYNFADGAHRVDPVALQPQDFAEEWLTQPWSEMESRSDPKTKEWHDRLQDYSGEYAAVIPCVTRPGRWLIALNFTWVGLKEMSEPLETYFLVRDFGNYHYEMEAVSASRPSGCAGTGPVSDKHPWLSEAELKALR